MIEVDQILALGSELTLIGFRDPARPVAHGMDVGVFVQTALFAGGAHHQFGFQQPAETRAVTGVGPLGIVHGAAPDFFPVALAAFAFVGFLFREAALSPAGRSELSALVSFAISRTTLSTV